MLVWLAPDATELPPHVHASETETFRTLEGELTVVVDGEPERLGPDETDTVDPGESHYFRNDTDEVVAFRVQVPWTRTIDTQYVSAGLDHEGYFGADGGYGEPGVLQGLLLAEYVEAETRIDLGLRIVQRALWASVGRVAKWTGRRAMDEQYFDDAFWAETVEQPDI